MLQLQKPHLHSLKLQWHRGQKTLSRQSQHHDMYNPIYCYNMQGEELIALAGAVSIKIAEGMSFEELITLTEFLGLLRHNLDIIRQRKIIKKIEQKKEQTHI